MKRYDTIRKIICKHRSISIARVPRNLPTKMCQAETYRRISEDSSVEKKHIRDLGTKKAVVDWRLERNEITIAAKIFSYRYITIFHLLIEYKCSNYISELGQGITKMSKPVTALQRQKRTRGTTTAEAGTSSREEEEEKTEGCINLFGIPTIIIWALSKIAQQKCFLFAFQFRIDFHSCKFFRPFNFSAFTYAQALHYSTLYNDFWHLQMS